MFVRMLQSLFRNPRARETLWSLISALFPARSVSGPHARLKVYNVIPAGYPPMTTGPCGRPATWSLSAVVSGEPVASCSFSLLQRWWLAELPEQVMARTGHSERGMDGFRRCSRRSAVSEVPSCGAELRCAGCLPPVTSNHLRIVSELKRRRC